MCRYLRGLDITSAYTSVGAISLSHALYIGPLNAWPGCIVLTSISICSLENNLPAISEGCMVSNILLTDCRLCLLVDKYEINCKNRSTGMGGLSSNDLAQNNIASFSFILLAIFRKPSSFILVMRWSACLTVMPSPPYSGDSRERRGTIGLPAIASSHTRGEMLSFLQRSSRISLTLVNCLWYLEYLGKNMSMRFCKSSWPSFIIWVMVVSAPSQYKDLFSESLM